MVKDNIISLIGKSVATLLDRVIENLIHTGNIDSCIDNCRKILECALQGSYNLCSLRNQVEACEYVLQVVPVLWHCIIAIVIGCVDSLSLKEIKDDCKNCHATPNYPKDAKALK